MNDTPMSLPSLQAIFRTRSMGVKLVVVCVLALVMTIPALFVGGLVEERTRRATDVTREIGSHVGGQQTFLGPTLAIPYTVAAQITGNTAEHGTYLVFPVQGGATVKTRTEERRRSLFKVPVFEANLRLDATFDLTGVPLAAPLGAVLDWSQARACRRCFGCPRGIGRWHSYGQRKNRLISSDRQHRRLITLFERQPEPAYTAHALRSYGL